MLQLDIWETHPEDKVVIAAVTPAQVRWLRGQGYRLEIDSGKMALLSVTASLAPRHRGCDQRFGSYTSRR